MNNLIINPSLAIGLVITNEKNEILLVKEKRDKYYEKTRNIWGLPAGKVEWDEPIELGIRREMKEELNVDISILSLIGVYQYLRKNSQCIGLAFHGKIRGDKIDYNPEEIQEIQWLKADSILRKNIILRQGYREVVEDYLKGDLLPYKNVRFFDLQS